MKEHRLTISQLQESLDHLGLVFDGFSTSAAHVMSQYRKMFPDDPKGMVLMNWAEFEKEHPNTFRGMYQFWCRKAS